MSGMTSSTNEINVLVPTAITQGTLKGNASITFSSESSDGACRITSAVTGALTANTLATALSVTGRGAISFFMLAPVDATSRTHRIKITLDGVVIYDKTSSASTNANLGVPVLGSVIPYWNGSVVGWSSVEMPLYYEQSLLIEYASSLSETGKTRFGYINYEM